MMKNQLSKSKDRFDKLFEGWDSKPHYPRKNSKNPDKLEYYLMTETNNTLPLDEQSPNIIIDDTTITIRERYNGSGAVLYSGQWLSDSTILEIIHINIEKLDLMLLRRQLKRLEWRLQWVDNDKQMSAEQILIEKKELIENINELKQLLKCFNDIVKEEGKQRKNK